MTIFLRCVLASYLFLMSCASAPKIQPVAKISKSWADNTLADLSIRERIAQMMIYSMSMQFEKVSETKWEEVFTNNRYRCHSGSSFVIVCPQRWRYCCNTRVCFWPRSFQTTLKWQRMSGGNFSGRSSKMSNKCSGGPRHLFIMSSKCPRTS